MGEISSTEADLRAQVVAVEVLRSVERARVECVERQIAAEAERATAFCRTSKDKASSEFSAS